MVMPLPQPRPPPPIVPINPLAFMTPPPRSFVAAPVPVPEVVVRVPVVRVVPVVRAPGAARVVAGVAGAAASCKMLVAP